MPPARTVLILAYDGFQSLDVTGPLEVFAGAAQLAGDTRAPAYRVLVAAPTAAPVRSSSGLLIVPETSIARAPRTVDTLIVAGGPGRRAACADARLLAWLRRRAPTTRRLTSVCTGAFLLAEAGLLDGRKATTHWSACAELAERYPRVAVDPEPIFTRDGSVYTSAGVTAGMDLALALVEDDLGRDAALTIARWLVLFLRRPGGQSQFSAQLSGQLAQRNALRDLQRWIVEHPAEQLAVERLAERAAMSPRHFARAFAHEVGVTPGRYVERIRVEAARRLLEDTPETVAQVAAACGFGTPETMRRRFIRSLGVPPAEYRRRFETTTAA